MGKFTYDELIASAEQMKEKIAGLETKNKTLVSHTSKLEKKCFNMKYMIAGLYHLCFDLHEQVYDCPLLTARFEDAQDAYNNHMDEQ